MALDPVQLGSCGGPRVDCNEAEVVAPTRRDRPTHGVVRSPLRPGSRGHPCVWLPARARRPAPIIDYIRLHSAFDSTRRPSSRGRSQTTRLADRARLRDSTSSGQPTRFGVDQLYEERWQDAERPGHFTHVLSVRDARENDRPSSRPLYLREHPLAVEALAHWDTPGCVIVRM